MADDDFDSLLLVATVPRIMRVVISDVEAILEVVRGMLSIDDCDEAVKITQKFNFTLPTHAHKVCHTYFAVAAYDDNASGYPQNSSTLEHLCFSSFLTRCSRYSLDGVDLHCPH